MDKKRLDEIKSYYAQVSNSEYVMRKKQEAEEKRQEAVWEGLFRKLQPVLGMEDEQALSNKKSFFEEVRAATATYPEVINHYSNGYREAFITAAAKKNDRGVIKELIKGGAVVFDSILTFADVLKHCNTETLDILCAANKGILTFNGGSCTPVFMVAYSANSCQSSTERENLQAIMEYLIERGAELTLESSNGNKQTLADVYPDSYLVIERILLKQEKKKLDKKQDVDRSVEDDVNLK